MSSGKAVLRNAAKQARWKRNTSRLIKKYLLRGYDGEYNYSSAKSRFDLFVNYCGIYSLYRYEPASGIGTKIENLCKKKGLDTKLFSFSKCLINGPFLSIHGHSKEFLRFLDLIDIRYMYETFGEQPHISIILNQDIGDKVKKPKSKKPVNVSTETITIPHQSKSEFEYIKDTIDNIIKEKAIAENKVIFLNSQLEEAKGMMRRLVKDYI
ncbi:hypothetical protein ASswx1_100 [Aeromonas phage Asswx_1]|uniref:Uncharacterized protein n=1 Tax=Aeromonas phage Asswx_1 TaxID=2419739 RepID=A0A411B7Z7_9CAUD|nr:hypothetical protein ASswx1_100 [Aeromonas phage Asswx_1]